MTFEGLGAGRELKKPIPEIREGNQRPPFLGMTGNGNSRSPLEIPQIITSKCFVEVLVNTRGIYSALRGWKLQLRDIHGSALKRCRFALAPAPQEMITRSGPQILLIITAMLLLLLLLLFVMRVPRRMVLAIFSI